MTPKRTSARLSMLASTGRRMERSESFIGRPRGSSSKPYFGKKSCRHGGGTSPYGTRQVEIHPRYYIDSSLTPARTRPHTGAHHGPQALVPPAGAARLSPDPAAQISADPRGDR